MRFKLTLEVNKYAFGNILPINYQYEASAAVYRILSRASEDYAAWLHDNGFTLENRETPDSAERRTYPDFMRYGGVANLLFARKKHREIYYL